MHRSTAFLELWQGLDDVKSFTTKHHLCQHSWEPSACALLDLSACVICSPIASVRRARLTTGESSSLAHRLDSETGEPRSHLAIVLPALLARVGCRKRRQDQLGLGIRCSTCVEAIFPQIRDLL
eukprot:scaffold1817_cov250-Pinguiococcus_pyrenoidosus.AAC.12